MLDKHGKPLRLYHATRKSFRSFIPGGSEKPEEWTSGPATWLSPYADRQPAAHNIGGYEGRFKEGTNVLPLHADIRNPLVIDNKIMRDWAKESYASGSDEFPLLISPETRKALIEDGYDGILWAGHKAASQDEAFYDKHEVGEHPDKDEEVIALHPPGRVQLKSAIGNRGTFNPDDPNITLARGGTADNDKAIRRALMIARADGGKTAMLSMRRYNSPARDAFMSEYEDDTHPHPFMQNARFLNTETGQPKGSDFAMLEMRPEAFEETPTVHLNSIMAMQPRSGQGTQALEYVKQLADKHGVTLRGYAKQFGRDTKTTMSTPLLKKWYAKHGFDVTSAGYMHRPPGGAPPKVKKPRKAAGGEVAAHHLEETAHAIHERDRADGGPVPPFKLSSGAAKVVAAKGQAKATPQQYAALPGIKPDEIKHGNLEALGTKALPREEVIKHLEANAVPLQETVLARSKRPKRPLNDIWDEAQDLEDGTAHLHTLPKFQKYSLPGGKNYREVLLTLPEKEPSNFKDFESFFASQYKSYHPGTTAYEMGRRDAQRIWNEASGHVKNHGDKSNYTSSHWDEPNVLAHIRMSDRNGPNGEKVLHVEELQSDWGQEGRENGFQNPEAVARQKQLHQELQDTKKAHVNAQREVDTRHKENMRAFDAAYKEAMGDAENKFTASRMLQSDVEEYNRASDAALEKTKHLLEPAEKTRQEEYQKVNAAYLPRIEAMEREFAALPKHGDTPSGPYVDTTQKWTDLALKRVLHEAAHGGYDKVVFTPGVEQNKRYSLATHLSRLDYHAPSNTLHATDKTGRHVLSETHKPEELAGMIGKEAADRLLSSKPDQMGIHSLSGLNLEVGGAGMRGYYDNIMPKRLQALAQQHDPKSRVQLGAEPLVENAAPLHSLDVTPQMRDSIKANGFNQFKRGGEVGDPIAHWHWRPLEDVRNELQLDEIPSHVHKFGEFMDETARRAATHGLTPRDLIKAYAITRSSIGRQALPVDTVREAFTELPADLTGRIRPEGAMGHWLHTKMGQRYLDAAEAGRVDDEAIAHAQKSMRRFGKEQTEPSALRWAALNLPGREGRVSELIARAHRGQSAPEEWRGEMRMPGIAESKAGFLASMLGRGDQPTLDARQIILHTGQPTKEATQHLGRKGAAEAAVNRLAERQSALGFKHAKEMSPFYQHLAHHAIWDKAAGEKTTHEDLMQALRGAKDGGRQGYARGGGDKEKPLSLIASHPVVQGMAAALPPEAELRALLRKAGIVRPYDQPNKENIEKALEIARTYAMPLGVGSKEDPSAYYNVKQPVAARDVKAKATATKGYSLKPEKAMSWKEFGDIGKGGHILNLSGDRTRFGTLHEINGKKLNWPVKVFAGPDYIREPIEGLAWASATSVVSGLNDVVKELSKKGPVFGMYSPYSGTGGDFAHHMFDAVMAQVNPDDLTKKAKQKFNVAMRNAHFIMGGTEKIVKARDRIKQKMSGWPGIDDPKAASEFARTKLTGDERKAILEYLDKKMWADEGFPHVGMTRVAVTDPKLLGVPQNVIGGNVALLKPSDKLPTSQHPSFPAGMAGEYVGTVPFAPRHYALPVTTGHFVKTPSAGKGVYIDPYSLNDRARSGYRTLFERNYVPEPVSERMVEGAEEGIKKMPLYGLKKGGRANYADGGGIDQLMQNLHGTFSQLNQQVAAPAAGATPAPPAAAPYTAPSYNDMVTQALGGKKWTDLFPTPASPPPPPPPAAATPAADAKPDTHMPTNSLGFVDYSPLGAGYASGGRIAPTEAQKHAGNYRKGHITFHGLPISIETPKGAMREGKEPSGKVWRCTMPADYGYIKRTEGADGDHVDVFVGPDKDSRMVFIINQNDHRTGHFDEHKVMLAYSSERAAVADYVKAFSDGKGHARIGSVEPMSLDAFKHWLKRGRTKSPAKSKSIVEHALAVTRSMK